MAPPRLPCPPPGCTTRFAKEEKNITDYPDNPDEKNRRDSISSVLSVSSVVHLASVDGAFQIIMVCDVTEAAHDKQQAAPMAQAALENLGRHRLLYNPSGKD